MISLEDRISILNLLDRYGPIPATDGLDPAGIERRMTHDKKTLRKRIHFVLPERIGRAVVRADIPRELPLAAIARALEECA